MAVKKITMILVSFCLTSCGLKYIDHPGPKPEDLWVKNGVSRNDISRVLKQCGYNNSTWTIAQQEKVDKCMLSQSFVFTDSPYGDFGSLCKYSDYQELPSCRSLINTHK